MEWKTEEQGARQPMSSLYQEQNRALAIWFAKVASRRGYVPPLPASVLREQRKRYKGGISQ